MLYFKHTEGEEVKKMKDYQIGVLITLSVSAVLQYVDINLLLVVPVIVVIFALLELMERLKGKSTGGRK